LRLEVDTQKNKVTADYKRFDFSGHGVYAKHRLKCSYKIVLGAYCFLYWWLPGLCTFRQRYVVPLSIPKPDTVDPIQVTVGP